MHLITSSLILLGARFLLVQSADFSCSKIDLNGTVVDLSAINSEFKVTQQLATPPTTNDYIYKINPCQGLKEDDGLPKEDRCAKDSWGCRTIINYKDKSPRIVDVVAIAAGESNQIPKIYSTKNEKNNTEEEPPKKGDPPKDKEPEKKPDKKPDNEETNSSGFIPFIFKLMFYGFAIYLIVGMIYNHMVLSATGLDLIPNREFWMEFPSLVVGFVSSIFNSTRGINRTGYNLV
ncbi:hypothetical protein BB559_003128 [Furculomyces boomerangus]|uniref:Uncharacterized protein n=1 Tax=Furculomyces boomerangus TaxID=61424 RepID=A0A2T9YNM1_9FUNG|nr:hypothetical protein BB559_003128 [Furculomyces boomerangus]